MLACIKRLHSEIDAVTFSEIKAAGKKLSKPSLPRHKLGILSDLGARAHVLANKKQEIIDGLIKKSAVVQEKEKSRKLARYIADLEREVALLNVIVGDEKRRLLIQKTNKAVQRDYESISVRFDFEVWVEMKHTACSDSPVVLQPEEGHVPPPPHKRH